MSYKDIEWWQIMILKKKQKIFEWKFSEKIQINSKSFWDRKIRKNWNRISKNNKKLSKKTKWFLLIIFRNQFKKISKKIFFKKLFETRFSKNIQKNQKNE